MSIPGEELHNQSLASGSPIETHYGATDSHSTFV
jgi:hypothetical protein